MFKTFSRGSESLFSITPGKGRHVCSLRLCWLRRRDTSQEHALSVGSALTPMLLVKYTLPWGQGGWVLGSWQLVSKARKPVVARREAQGQKVTQGPLKHNSSLKTWAKGGPL